MGLADIAAGLLAAPPIGTVPGWKLVFTAKGAKPLSLDERDYRAEIETVLSGGLDAGSTSIRLLGIVDAHAKWLSGAMAKGPVELDLFLGWRTKPMDELPQVAALRVKTADRRAEGLRWIAVIEAEERAVAMLAKRRVSKSLKADNAVEAAVQLIEAQTPAPPVVRHLGPALPPTGEPPPKEEAERGVPVLETLARLAGRAEDRSGRFGRGAVLIRRGAIHFGTGRPVPFGEGAIPGKKVPLSQTGTLMEVRAREPQVTDPNVDFAAAGAPEQAPQRRRFELHLLGAPTLLPGDVVTFHPPDEPKPGSGLGGAIAAAASSFIEMPVDPSTPEASLYVETIAHRLALATGFITVLTGVVIDGKGAEAGQWDTHTPLGAARAPTTGTGADGTPAGRVAAELRRLAERDDGKRAPEVAEIRSHSLPAGDTPALTSTVLDGLAGADAGAAGGGAAWRLDLDRATPHLREVVPYLSPFALGPYGQVLPRLPGMRVLLAYRGGDPTDPVEIGSFRRANDEVPEGVQEGDWWLILPAVGAMGDAPGVADPVPPPGRFASDDLIDNEGNRVIEVGSLTVRVGKTALDDPGKRPAKGAASAVTIEHADGKSKITMTDDGEITIEAAADLTIRTPAKLTLEAASVEVKLGSGGTMDVKGG